MNGDRLVHLIINPGSSTDEDTLELNRLADEYPYFSCLSILNAKIASLRNSEARDMLITRAAIISPDRVQLKKYITSAEIFAGYTIPETIGEEVSDAGHMEVIPERPTVAEPADQKVVQVAAAFQPDAKNIQEPAKENITASAQVLPADQNITKTIIPPARAQTLQPGKDIVEELKKNTEEYRKSLEKYFKVLNMFTESSTKPVREDPLADPKQTEEKFRDILETSRKRKTSRKMAKEEQDMLISKFIETGSENRKQVKQEQEEETPAEDLSLSSSELHDEMVTETLAGIMVKQGKLEKAIDIYHKLIWKFPQKKSYFAAQIEILKEKISKQ